MFTPLESSETHRNLMRAFAGESQARNRYTFAASQAKKNKLEVLRQVFLFTADQERAHGKLFYEALQPMNGKTITVDGGYPVDLGEDMAALLRAAEHNEAEEAEVVYPAFAETAQQEGYEGVARLFRAVAAIEKTHASRFGHLAELLEKGKLFVAEAETGWLCLNCGHIIRAAAAPAMCPTCKHDQGFFVRLELAPWTGKEIFQN